MSVSKHFARTWMRFSVLAAGAFTLSACLWDGKSDPVATPAPAPAPLYSVGGTVSGLSGTVVLANSGGDLRTVTTSGAFTFATSLATNSAYSVTVATQPAGQTCSTANGSGTVAASNVTNVAVTCTTTPTVGSASIGPAGGTVNGFYGAQIVVPAGALASTVTIGLSRDSTNSPAFAVTSTDAVGATYELTPHGQSFTVPVTLRIPFDAAQVPNDTVPVLYKAETGGAFTALPTTVNGNFLEATVTGFSWVLPAAAATKPRMVYAVQVGAPNVLASFRINNATGALTGPTSTAPVGQSTSSLVAHPSRRFLYITHGGSTTVNGIDPATISVYPLNTINGQIAGGPSSTTASGAVVGSNLDPALPVIHPNGKFMYIVNRADITKLAIDGTTGALSGLTSVTNGNGAAPQGIAFNRLGTLAYVPYIYTSNVPVGDTTYWDTVKVYSVDPATGLLTGPVASAPTGNNPWSVSVDPNDRFVFVSGAGSSANDVRVYSITAGGGITYRNATAALNEPQSLAGDPFGRFLFVGKRNPFFNVNVLFFQVDATTPTLLVPSGSTQNHNGVLTLCAGGGCVGPISVAADPQGQFVYALDANQGLSAFAVNQTTGELTGAGSIADIYRPGPVGVGVPFKFAVSGTSPVWQSNCTHGCVMIGTVSSPGGGSSTSNPSPPSSYFLQVTQGAFFGSVTSSPGGISYGPLSNNSAAQFPANSNVQLCASPPAQPSQAYDITWTGSCSGTGTCASVSMGGDRQCHVEFSPVIGR